MFEALGADESLTRAKEIIRCGIDGLPTHVHSKSRT